MKRLHYSLQHALHRPGRGGDVACGLRQGPPGRRGPRQRGQLHLQHKLALYREAEWWHHKPVIPELPGSELANATAIALPYFTSQVPELIDQYAKAFEKVWGQRKELAKA